jgi:hypothetical protein
MRGNRFAAMSHARAIGDNERLEHDEYETPNDVTDVLLDHVKFTGPVLEPSSGSGRMARRIRERTGLHVEARDICLGHDYLKFRDTWHGDTITNPPYHKGMADAFVARALATTTGKVAMLLQAGFMFGSDRTQDLFRLFPPELVITVPWRIRFYIGDSDKKIRSQAYNHCWFVWDNQRLGRPATRLLFPALTQAVT